MRPTVQGRTCATCGKGARVLTECRVCGIPLWCSTGCSESGEQQHNGACASFLNLNTTPGFGFVHVKKVETLGDDNKGVQLFPPGQLAQIQLRKYFSMKRPKKFAAKALVLSVHNADDAETLEEGRADKDKSLVILDECRQLTYIASVLDISRNEIGRMVNEQSHDFIEFAKVAGTVFIPVVILILDDHGSISGYRLSLLMNNYPLIL